MLKKNLLLGATLRPEASGSEYSGLGNPRPIRFEFEADWLAPPPSMFLAHPAPETYLETCLKITRSWGK